MFTLPDLSYSYNALEPYIDEQTMRIHHDLHHGTYVKNLNEALSQYPEWFERSIEEIMANLSQIPENIRTKVRNNGGGHYNHALFWEIMKPGGAKEPTGPLRDAIQRECGDFETFKKHFSDKGLGRFGSGWVWLVKNSDGSVTIMDTPNQDNPVMEGKKPILGLDVWEHAYYLKYQNRRGEYIQAWWHVVNWTEVERRYALS
ncbi:MAG: superoxide dismutase [Patescibacteria group bacterium]|nr:superoxide dismutase [Patescibacteria group bacterium]